MRFARELALEMVRPRHLMVLVLATMADFLATLHLYSLNRSWLVLMCAAGFLIPVANHFAYAWFVNTTKQPARWAITLHTSIGLCLGSIATVLVCR